MKFDTICLESSILYLYCVPMLPVKLSIKLSFSVPVNCHADPEEMWHCEAFQLGLHCLPKSLFNSIQNEKR